MEQIIFYVIAGTSGTVMLISLFWKKFSLAGAVAAFLIPAFFAGWDLKSGNFINVILYLAVLAGIILALWWKWQKTKDTKEYSREDLVGAMQRYNKQFLEDPQAFADIEAPASVQRIRWII